MSPINEPIAVVGSACRFPGGSTTPSKLWKLLSQPRDVLSRIDRFRAPAFYHTDGHHHGASNVLDAYMLADDPRAFDTQFFSIQAGEADSIDPQQRLLLETVYEGLETAGLTIEGLQGSSTAVYVGVMCDDYNGICYHDGEAVPKYAATGTARSIMSNRVSYFFNWTGPSMTIDTACSSSLVAVHQAVQVLRSGESRVAVAAGSNLIFGPKMFIAESNLNMLSPTGRSQMWDANANGYARGEGVASVVLKTLSAAIADGDNIECIIRETGVNQDGRTPGITMPSSTAQAKLIRETYARAGLDIRKKSDRCQYFEAHGTGTKAGDPQEAGAIYRAFFAETGLANTDEVLHVGSIKTVIGHTEGTAGIAGLMKASLAIQNKTIPPNMHFNKLNPELEPFYGNLKVSTEAQAWPELPEGTPRRVSVNSFGFGGTNAHAIIESYEPSKEVVGTSTGKVSIPFTFSAPSEKSLAAQLNTYLSFLGENEDVDLKAMAWTLSRRSAFAYRTAVSATTAESLRTKLEAKLEAKKNANTAIGIRQIKECRSILGVFTGQGAQWPAMAGELILSSPYVSSIIDSLEQSLATLPKESDRPTWSLRAEMLKQGKESRIAEGLLSQPLCTAVQVVLVNILAAAGISFSAVVGHSSGEIGAAYAAGYISAHDAIRIAYYRGFYAKLAKGRKGEKGGMLAAGTSMEDANELCQLENFEGKLQVAASNSSSSVTLSGDVDAVEEAMEILKDEGKFARQLKVDTAYHSHHMEPCSVHYVQSLKDCKIQILAPPEGACKWYSSVLGGPIPVASDGLDSTYWMKNMLQPVLFSQALTQALAESGAPAIAMEVGPHPALKGPATATIEEVLGGEAATPYTGTLSRGGDDVEALAECLGFLWTRFGPSIPDFKTYMQLFNKDASEKISLMKTLPPYTFDHDRTYFYESRSSRVQRLRKDPTHELLGVRQDDEAEGEYRWRNFLKPSEIPWLKGHTIQGQMLFPAAGFAVMAIEASKFLAPPPEVSLVELHNFSIHRGLSFPDEAAGVETLLTLSNITKSSSAGTITANFSIDACANKDTGNLLSMSNGTLILRLGAPAVTALPDRPKKAFQLKETDVDDFYTSLAAVGYNYSDLFRGISSLQRATDLSSGTIYIPDDSFDEPCPYIIHPATLDVGFQALFGCIGAPGDGRLWTLHVPTIISRIKINPAACPAGAGLGVELPFKAGLAAQEANQLGFTGDVAIYDEQGKHCLVQCESVRISTLGEPTKAEDRHIFSETAWGGAEPNAALGYEEIVETDAQQRAGELVQRSCLAFLKRLDETITPEEREKCDEHCKRVLNWAAHVVDVTAKGEHPILKKEWLQDTVHGLNPRMLALAEEHPDMHDLIFVGESLIPFVRDQLDMMEEFKKQNMLERLNKYTKASVEYNAYVAGIVKQLQHRFPYMNILEIGARAGSTTEAIIKEIGHSYSSYTYTDVSEGFFKDASETFKDHSSGFIYKVLDIEKDVTEQGFSDGAYDLIVAANVLHATHSLDATMTNTRKLLRPGGYLVLMEITEIDWLHTGFMFSGMQGWWVGADDDRPYTPAVPKSKWDAVLRRTGFSGVDTSTPDSKAFMAPFSVMISQAIDTQMALIRQPLAATPTKPLIDNLLIVGGQQMVVFDLVEEVQKMVEPFCGSISVVDKIENLTEDNFSPQQTVLCLAELEEFIFKPFNEQKYKAMQNLVESSRNILWASKGAQGEQPYARMMYGVARTLVSERQAGFLFQVIDVDVDAEHDPKLLAETLLRAHIWDSWADSTTPYDPLWSMERDIYLSNGSVLIPRYGPSKILDERYNSIRRVIKSPRSLETATVEITAQKGAAKYDLEELLKSTFETKPAADLVTIRVKRSVLTSVKVKSIGFLYLVIGEDVKTQKKVLALSEAQRSTVAVPKTWTIACDVSEEDERSLLIAAANRLVADSILSKASTTGSFLVHEPSPLLARALSQTAAEKKIPITFTSATSEDPLFSRIHPSTPQSVIESLFSNGVSVFVDLSTSTDSERVGARIEKQLPAKCKRRNVAAFLCNEGFVRADVANQSVEKVLSEVYARSIAELPSTDFVEQIENVALNDIASVPIQTDALRTVDWTVDNTVPVKTVLAQEKVRFRDNKTYWMIGATGELGLSITRWMVERGAKYIVLTSRNPNIDPEWLDAMAAAGAIVKVMAMDVTSRASLMGVYKTIKKTLPPIAGVANAAMVLTDGLFATMPYDTFNKVLRPKVDGTAFLDELFPNNDLDFFILFSSLTYVAGNLGQTPYAVANAFMVALAEGRRKRGLAGSVMNLAGIFGVGYIARTDKSIHDRLGAMGYANISEWDFHQFFAEAVISSHPSSGRNFEISNGVRPFDPDRDTDLPFWINIPRFSYYKVIKANASAGKADKRTVSIRAQLKEQTTEEGVRQVLLTGFLATLYKQLHMPPEDNGITPESSLVELGIDSLVAVDMRSWFHREFDLDMPVLKILGGATVAGMVDDAFNRLSKNLIPNVQATEEAKAEEAKPEAEKEGSIVGGSETSLSSSMVIVSSSDEESQQGTDTSPGSSVPPVDDRKNKALAPKPLPVFEKTERMAYGASQFWFLSQYLEDPTVFNIQFRLALSGSLNVARIERAVQELGQRHEAFRTAFFANPDRLNEPTQGVMANSLLRLEKKVLNNEEELDKESEAMLNHVWDIERGEVIRVILVSLNPKTHFMIFGFHHICIDGFGFNLLLIELNDLYTGKQLQPVQAHFSDFAARQRMEVENGSMEEEIKFWKQTFVKIPEILPLFPVAKVAARRTITNYEQEEPEEIILDSKTVAQIKDICRRNGSTKFHFFLAVLKVFLFRFLDVEDICIGLADANRNNGAYDLTMGYMLNLLPLLFSRSPKQSFADAIKEARNTSYAALAHSRVPFDILLDTLDVPRSSTNSPLFQVFMDYRQINAKMPLLGARSHGVQAAGRTAYDLVLDISDIGGSEIRVNFKGQKYLYSKEGTEILLKSFVRLVKSVAANSKVDLETVELYDSVDVRRAVELGRGPVMTSEWPATASHRIDDVVLANRERIALKDGVGNVFTYGAMAERVDVIASSLLDARVSEGSFVAIFQEPTADWICSLLAIWKVGAVFVPLELRNSLPRLAMIANDCKASAILCHEATIADVPALNAHTAKTINISTLANLKKGTTIFNLSKAKSAGMILYSSGTTGTPKGIILQHGAIRNQVEGYSRTYKVGKEVILQQTAYSFDIALMQVVLGLTNGGTLYVASKSQRMDPVELSNLVDAENVTYTMGTPSEYFSWIRANSTALARATSWKVAFSGGEAITNDLKNELRALKRPDLKLTNNYGPAEVTVESHSMEIEYLNSPENSKGPIPVGKTNPNYATYIVDRNMQPVPVGVSGEIVIGGPGVSMGYLNNKELTESQFILDTLAPAEFASKEFNKVYRTGDMGRLQPDGSVLCHGRITGDTQIKFHGIRIEMKDIENTIIKTANGVIFRAVASVRGDPGFLVAHVEFSATNTIDNKEEFLKDLMARLPLPRYMCPAMIVPVDMMPLNNHGKIDRRAIGALPLSQEPQTSESDEFLSETELALLDVWKSVISKDIAETVAIHGNTDFFHIGGNSLLLVRLQATIRERFNVVVPMTDMFEASTLRTMAHKIDSSASVANIDWKAETTVADVASHAFKKIVKSKTGSGLTVLLTGSTGYLGRRFLQQLVEDNRVSRIHAVAVRKDNPKNMPRDILKQSPKIVAHEGNLSVPMLGMSEETFSTLADEVDVIIHSGADRSFTDFYQVLRGPNVSSTKELIKLAAASGRKVPIHFISSSGVLDLAGTSDAQSVTAYPPPTNGSNGYVASKWASEALLSNASSHLGVPVSIHRVTPLPISETDRQTQEEEVIKHFAQICSKMKILPEASGWTGSFDLIHTTTLSSSLLSSALTPLTPLTPYLSKSRTQAKSKSMAPAETIYIHYPAQVRMKMADLETYLSTTIGDEQERAAYATMPPHFWAGEAKRAGLGWHFASMAMGVGGGEEGDGFELKR